MHRKCQTLNKTEQCLVPFNGIHLLAPNDYTHWLFSAEKKMNNSFYSGCTLPTVVFQFQYINNTFSLHKTHIPDQSKCIAVFPSIVSDGLFSFYWTIIILFLFDFCFYISSWWTSWIIISKMTFHSEGFMLFSRFFPLSTPFLFCIHFTFTKYNHRFFHCKWLNSLTLLLLIFLDRKNEEKIYKSEKKNVFIRSKKNVLEKIIEKHFAFKKISME